MTSSNETRAKHKRSARSVFEKLLWLGFCGLGILILWVALVIAFSLLLQPKEQSETIMLLGYTTITLAFLMGLFMQKYRNDKRLIYRWTGKSLLILIAPVLIISGLIVLIVITAEPSDNSNTNTNAISGNQGYVPPEKMNIDLLLKETNLARTTNGRTALTINTALNTSAGAKCLDMVKNDYWSHNSKTGATPWDFISNTGYAYTTAGENLAYGFSSEKGVLVGWMNSPGHKENIMKGEFTEVGFGICDSTNYLSKGKQTIVVQHFGNPAKAAQTQPAAPTPTRTYKAYVAPVCTKVPIPYKTVYVDASYMSIGETKEYGGTDGYTNTCTADSTGYRPADYTLSPYDKTIYRGTRPLPEPATPSPIL